VSVAPAAEAAAVRRPPRRFGGYAFDLDGTLYLGEQPLPGAAEAVAEDRRQHRLDVPEHRDERERRDGERRGRDRGPGQPVARGHGEMNPRGRLPSGCGK